MPLFLIYGHYLQYISSKLPENNEPSIDGLFNNE